MKRHNKKHHSLHKLLLIVFGCLLLFSQNAQAEYYSNDPQAWLQDMGPIAFDWAGGMHLPTPVLDEMSTGGFSPMMQFVLINHTIDECVKSTVSTAPGLRDSYKTAVAVYESGLCRMQKCFQQAMLLQMLPMMSDNPYAGGSTSSGQQDMNQNLLMTMATSFGGQEGCDDSGSSGFDQNLLMLLASSGGDMDPSFMMLLGGGI